MATAHPPSSSPTMRSAGTCTSSNATSASSSVPLACSIGRTSTPGERRSTMNAVRPAVPRLGGAGAGQHEAPGGVAGPARPDLAAVDDVAVAVAGPPWCGGWRGPSRRRARRSPGPRARGRRGTRGAPRRRTAGRAVRDERRGEDLEVLEQRHAGHAVAGEASHIAARCRIVPPSPPTVRATRTGPTRPRRAASIRPDMTWTRSAKAGIGARRASRLEGSPDEPVSSRGAVRGELEERVARSGLSE